MSYSASSQHGREDLTVLSAWPSEARLTVMPAGAAQISVVTELVHPAGRFTGRQAALTTLALATLALSRFQIHRLRRVLDVEVFGIG